VHWSALSGAGSARARACSATEPAKYVKPDVQTNKSDFLDAEAIAEAVQRPGMRFVPIKTEEQLDLQHLHRREGQECNTFVSGDVLIGNLPDSLPCRREDFCVCLA
jgi:hypothetical protein